MLAALVAVRGTERRTAPAANGWAAAGTVRSPSRSALGGRAANACFGGAALLIGERFVFLHVPKAAGKSLSRYMIEAWPGSVQGYVSQGQMLELKEAARPGVALEATYGHEDMAETQALLGQRGRRLEEMEAVFACVRNPYDIVVSTYFFMRRTFKNNSHRRFFKLANELDFEGFCTQFEPRRIEAWLTIDGKAPPNLRLIRFESLEADLAAVAAEYGFNSAVLPHWNRTDHGHYSNYVESAACECVIYEKYRYLFDSGLYRREAVG